jgi:transposase-like protein
MNPTPNQRRTYDEPFKRDTVALLESGRKAAQLARDLGISAWNLRDWKRLYGSGAAVASQSQARRRAQATPVPSPPRWSSPPSNANWLPCVARMTF